MPENYEPVDPRWWVRRKPFPGLWPNVAVTTGVSIVLFIVLGVPVVLAPVLAVACGAVAWAEIRFNKPFRGRYDPLGPVPEESMWEIWQRKRKRPR